MQYGFVTKDYENGGENCYAMFTTSIEKMNWIESGYSFWIDDSEGNPCKKFRIINIFKYHKNGDIDYLIEEFNPDIQIKIQTDIDKKLIEQKYREEEACINRLMEFVQEKIVPIDPPLVIGRLRTVDAAIIFYIDRLEEEIRNLKHNVLTKN